MNKQEDALTNYKHIYDKVFYLGIIEGVFSFIFLVFWFIAKFSLTYIIEIEKYVNRKGKDKEIALTSFDYFKIVFIHIILSRKEIITFIWNMVFSFLGVMKSTNIYLFSILTIVIFYFHFYKNQKVNIEVFVYYNCIMLKLCFI